MSHQDFEKYALEKKFNYSVSEKFKDVFSQCVSNLKMPCSEINLLDFGCGDGKHYHFFIENGFSPSNIYGAEVSQKRIKRCRQLGWQNTHFIKNNKLYFPDNKFDSIIMSEVIEHIPASKAEEVFRELSRVLKKNGFIIITTPNYPIKRFYDLHYTITHKNLKRIKDDPTHINRFNLKKLRGFLKKYFQEILILPYKDGFLFKITQKNFFMHKMIAIGRNKK